MIRCKNRHKIRDGRQGDGEGERGRQRAGVCVCGQHTYKTNAKYLCVRSLHTEPTAGGTEAKEGKGGGRGKGKPRADTIKTGKLEGDINRIWE